jgi:hypothetical protein
LEKNAVKREFTSVLIYRLQRKNNFESNVDNTLTNYRLLVIWRSDNRHEYSLGVLLIKHDNAITLDEDELKKLDYPPLVPLRNDRTIENTWALDNATVLVTTLKWEKRIRTTRIEISEGTRKGNSMVPLRVSNM